MMYNDINKFFWECDIMNDRTQIFDANLAKKKAEMRENLITIHKALTDNGHDAVNQIIGYILSEDPTYISKNVRHIIRNIDTYDLLRTVIEFYFEN